MLSPAAVCKSDSLDREIIRLACTACQDDLIGTDMQKISDLSSD